MSREKKTMQAEGIARKKAPRWWWAWHTQSRKIRPVVSDEVNQREIGVRGKVEDKARGQIISGPVGHDSGVLIWGQWKPLKYFSEKLGKCILWNHDIHQWIYRAWDMVYFSTIFTKFGLESWREREIAPTLLVCWDPLCSIRGSFVYRLYVSDIEYLLLLLHILLCLFCMVPVVVLHRIHRILILKKTLGINWASVLILQMWRQRPERETLQRSLRYPMQLLPSVLCRFCRSFVLFMIFFIFPWHFHIPWDRHAEHWSFQVFCKLNSHFKMGLLEQLFPEQSTCFCCNCFWSSSVSHFMTGKIPSASRLPLSSQLSSTILLLSEGRAHFCRSLWHLSTFCRKSLYSNFCSSCLSYEL